MNSIAKPQHTQTHTQLAFFLLRYQNKHTIRWHVLDVCGLECPEMPSELSGAFMPSVCDVVYMGKLTINGQKVKVMNKLRYVGIGFDPSTCRVVDVPGLRKRNGLSTKSCDLHGSDLLLSQT